MSKVAPPLPPAPRAPARPIPSHVRRRLTQTVKPREEAFILSFVQHFDPVRALLDARYPPGSPVTQHVRASRILNRPRVRKAISAILSAGKRIPTIEEVLGELGDIATAPWRDFITIIRDKDGNEVDVKLNLKDKITASELLLKAQHAFRDPLTKKLEIMLEREIRRIGARGLSSGLEGLVGGGGGSPSIPALPPGSPREEADVLDAEILTSEVVGGMKVPPKPGRAKREGKG